MTSCAAHSRPSSYPFGFPRRPTTIEVRGDRPKNHCAVCRLPRQTLSPLSSSSSNGPFRSAACSVHSYLYRVFLLFFVFFFFFFEQEGRQEGRKEGKEGRKAGRHSKPPQPPNPDPNQPLEVSLTGKQARKTGSASFLRTKPSSWALSIERESEREKKNERKTEAQSTIQRGIRWLYVRAVSGKRRHVDPFSAYVRCIRTYMEYLYTRTGHARRWRVSDWRR